jgi:hypothetical protein
VKGVRVVRRTERRPETPTEAGSYGAAKVDDEGSGVAPAAEERTMIARVRQNRGARIAFDMTLLTVAYMVSLVGFAYLMA